MAQPSSAQIATDMETSKIGDRTESTQDFAHVLIVVVCIASLIEPGHNWAHEGRYDILAIVTIIPGCLWLIKKCGRRSWVPSFLTLFLSAFIAYRSWSLHKSNEGFVMAANRQYQPQSPYDTVESFNRVMGVQLDGRCLVVIMCNILCLGLAILDFKHCTFISCWILFVMVSMCVMSADLKDVHQTSVMWWLFQPTLVCSGIILGFLPITFMASNLQKSARKANSEGQMELQMRGFLGIPWLHLGLNMHPHSREMRQSQNCFVRLVTILTLTLAAFATLDHLNSMMSVFCAIWVCLMQIFQANRVLKQEIIVWSMVLYLMVLQFVHTLGHPGGMQHRLVGIVAKFDLQFQSEQEYEAHSTLCVSSLMEITGICNQVVFQLLGMFTLSRRQGLALALSAIVCQSISHLRGVQQDQAPAHLMHMSSLFAVWVPCMLICAHNRDTYLSWCYGAEDPQTQPAIHLQPCAGDASCTMAVSGVGTGCGSDPGGQYVGEAPHSATLESWFRTFLGDMVDLDSWDGTIDDQQGPEWEANDQTVGQKRARSHHDSPHGETAPCSPIAFPSPSCGPSTVANVKTEFDSSAEGDDIRGWRYSECYSQNHTVCDKLEELSTLADSKDFSSDTTTPESENSQTTHSTQNQVVELPYDFTGCNPTFDFSASMPKMSNRNKRPAIAISNAEKKQGFTFTSEYMEHPVKNDGHAFVFVRMGSEEFVEQISAV